MLLRQHFNRLVEPVTLRLHFRPNLTHRHLVLRRIGTLGIFGPVFQKHNPPIRLQRLPNPIQHFLGFRKLVINIHQQDQIKRVLRQLRIVECPQHRAHICQMPGAHVFREQIQHRLLNIFPIDDAIRAHALSQPPREIADTRADIRNRRPLLNADRIQRLIRMLVAFSLRPGQPVRPSCAHHTGNAPMRDRMEVFGRANERQATEMLLQSGFFP